jgi:hypothetical protein
LLLAVAMLQPAALHAQDARLQARLDRPTVDSMNAILAHADALAIPREPLIQKALEGASKNATSALILNTVAAMSGRLALARHALGNAASEAELVAGASAIYAGVTPASLSQIGALHHDQSIAMPLVTLSYFIHEGVDHATALRWTENVVRKNVSPQELLRLQQSIEGDVRTGASPHAAAEARVEALLRQHQLAP